MIAAALALALNLLIVQPHVDLRGLDLELSQPHAAADLASTIKAPQHQGYGETCAICQAAASSRANVLPTPAATPTLRNIAFHSVELAPKRVATRRSSHLWRSRAPPIQL